MPRCHGRVERRRIARSSRQMHPGSALVSDCLRGSLLSCPLQVEHQQPRQHLLVAQVVGPAVGVQYGAVEALVGLGQPLRVILSRRYTIRLLHHPAAATSLTGNTVSNRLYGRPLAENRLQATAIGAVLEPLAEDISPTVGFRPGFSMTRGLWSPRAGYVGPNTEAVYWQEAALEVLSQFADTFVLTPAQASGLAAPSK